MFCSGSTIVYMLMHKALNSPKAVQFLCLNHVQTSSLVLCLTYTHRYTQKYTFPLNTIFKFRQLDYRTCHWIWGGGSNALIKVFVVVVQFRALLNKLSIVLSYVDFYVNSMSSFNNYSQHEHLNWNWFWVTCWNI